MTSNPRRILEVLDRFLHSPFDLYVYGRSALALGFPNTPVEYHATMDVDAILPMRDLQAIEANTDFWDAQEQTNRELGDTGLYFTHLFEERQVILTPDWLAHTVIIDVIPLHHLRISRPSTADLVLTKMMRVDPQDRDDICFLLRQPDVTTEQVQHALGRAVVPEIEEIQEAFTINRSWLEPKLS